MLKVKGIHHISSIVGHAQRNLDFYASILGMRLVKKTINFDDSSTYHFYFGNEDASTPVYTTFPWNDAVEGHNGSGFVGVNILAIPKGSLDFWEKRLMTFGIEVFRYTRFGRERLAFKDPDGIEIELNERKDGPINRWEYNDTKSKNAIKGVDGAILSSRTATSTLKLFTETLGFDLVDEDEENYLLQVHKGFAGSIEVLKNYEEIGKQGVGTVHHIAFAIENGSEDMWIQKLKDDGYRPTEVKDRKYFKSIYFREKGGILIELATEGPGFLVDESVEELGTNLLIPPHYKFISEEIKEKIMPVEVRPVTKLEGYGYRDRYEYEILQKKQVIKDEILALKVKQHEGKLSESEEKELEALKTQLRNVT